MKKNLRIVSVAAAALLAVAPVAASAVSTVNADPVTSVDHLGSVTLPNNGAVVNVKPNISLNTKADSVDAAISVSFSATVNGTTANANFSVNHTNPSNIQLFKGSEEIKDLNKVTEADAGQTYKVSMTNVGLNFGSQNANKKVTLNFGSDNWAAHNTTDAMKHSIEVKLDKNGVVNLAQVVMDVTAKNFADPTVVTWFDSTTKAPVKAGSITLYAGSDAGKMNVAQVAAKAKSSYFAQGAVNKYFAPIADPTDNIKAALKAMNVDVDNNGWFVAPKSFTFNMTATSNVNDATATLPVTVTVPNGKEVTPATVPSQSKTIMHNAYFYDKDAKRVGTDKVTRYNTVTVAMNTTKFSNGIEYYEVIENGKATGKYINAYTFKNGKKYYKIGADTKKTYVKVANFE